MVKCSFDLIVIGGGTAGLRTALSAVAHGYTAALIETDLKRLGGTCLNTGCIPTKAMLHASSLFQQTQNLKQFGINTGKIQLNFQELMKRVLGIIQTGQSHIKNSLSNKNLSVIQGKAVFLDENTVEIEKVQYNAKKIIICTGAKSRIPSIKGLDKTPYLLHEDVLKLKKLPKSILIVGGGYISLEFSTFFSQLGSKVTVVEHNDRILKEIDEDVSGFLYEEYDQRGISFMLGSNIEEIQKTKQGVKMILKDSHSKKQTIQAELLLVATGRVPNVFSLNLTNAKINLSQNGGIQINEKLQTSNPNVYAIGDVTGKTPFAHAAKRESYIALANALEEKSLSMPFDLVPWAIFTDPPIAGVGITENKAKVNNQEYNILKAEYNRAGKATVIGNTKGFAKVIFDPKSQEIKGAVIIGPKAEELIHEFVALLNCKAKVQDLKNVIHIHPTLSEVFEALK